MDALIATRLDADGMLLATLDMPGRTMNVFSVELMDALDALMDRVETDAAVRCVVLTSGKSSFLAGADLVMVRGYTDQAQVLDEDQLFALCGRLGRQFVRLEASAKPWVAAVNGIALGGGLELAMACRARIVVDDRRVQLGLPEVRWGLLPGAGGTQRLPRLAGFEAGLDLLLTGRSMAPEEAVARGVFQQAVPAAGLLDTARSLALELCGQAFDPSEKFPHLAQADVPAHSAEQAQALALQHGVSADDYRDYPAYGVIVDCVLLGARQPLAAATATEMRQFLRLMVDPVAGQMVRTLFLNRQRADRAMAAPPGLRVERLRHGALPAALALWAEALGKLKLPVTEDASLPPGVLELQDSLGAAHRAQLAVLAVLAAPATAGEHSAAPVQPGMATAVLSPAGPYGRVLEITGTDMAVADALAALAQRLGALSYRSGGPVSVLAAFSPAQAVPAIDEQARLALRGLAAGQIPQPEWLDVAACTAGLSPAWSGGPFAYLWAQRARLVPPLEAADAQAWAQAEAPLRDLFGATPVEAPLPGEQP